jgi:hypothetical protein
MSKRSKTQVLKANAVNATEVAAAVVKDKKFQKQIASAVAHATVARRRARRRKFAVATTIGRLSADPILRGEVRAMVRHLEQALDRMERKQSHKFRNSLLVAAGVGGAAAAFAQARK